MEGWFLHSIQREDMPFGNLKVPIVGVEAVINVFILVNCLAGKCHFPATMDISVFDSTFKKSNFREVTLA
jgi:hypothetical protein